MSKAKKISIITSLILIGLGIALSFGALCSVKFDFTKLSTTNFTTKSVTINESFQKIRIQDTSSDIHFVPSDDNRCTVVYTEDDDFTHSVSVEDRTLIIERKESQKLSAYIGINFGRDEIIVYLPQAEYESLDVEATNGNVEIPKDFTFTNASVHTGSGDICFEASVKEDLSISTEIGNVSVSEVAANNISAASTSGDIELSGIIAHNNIWITSTIGNVTLNHSDAASIDIVTTSGDVNATLLSDKIFQADSDSGDIHVPSSKQGGKCSISTTIGDIDVKIE